MPRLLSLHSKDLERPAGGAVTDGSRPHRSVELGRGNVDLKGLVKARADVGFRGWAIAELDREPEPGRTSKESAVIPVSTSSASSS